MPTGIYKRKRGPFTGKTHSEKSKAQMRINMKGIRVEKLNPAWKGRMASYFAKHIWLNSHFGKATRCENYKCKYPRKTADRRTLVSPKRFEWALRKGKTYQHKRENFVQLCASCHRFYDNRTKRSIGVKIPSH